MRALPASLALLLAGCNAVPVVPDREPSSPVPAQCDAACFRECKLSQPLQWVCNPSDPRCWDVMMAQVIKPLGMGMDQCENLNRRACSDCLLRLEKASVICGIKEPCHESK